MTKEYVQLRISARRANWEEIERYLYGFAYVAWDQLKETPRVFTDGDDLEYEVLIERHWIDAGQQDRLRSGMIGSRIIPTESPATLEV